MEAPKEPDKCKHCATTVPHDEEDRVLCDLCRDALYCSDACETADFPSHRDSCTVQERVLAMQKQCFTCTKRIGHSEEHCTVCSRIKYCSAACKEADKDKHNLICDAYAGLGPRPSKAHRICILFPAEEEKLRLIWVPMNDGLKGMTDVVAPEDFDIEVTSGPHVEYDNEVEDYRRICFVTVDEFYSYPQFAPNQSLGLAAIGRPLRTVRGPLLVTASECSFDDGREVDSDATPGELQPVLEHFKAYESMRRSGFVGELRGYSYDPEGNLVLTKTVRIPLPNYMR